MSSETVLCEVENSVATVTLNRPKVLNALNAQLFDELEAVFTALAAASIAARSDWKRFTFPDELVIAPPRRVLAR